MTLTPRERQIVTLLGDGLPPKEIARLLGTRPATVRQQLFRARERANCQTTAQLVYMAALDGETEG